MIQRFPTLRDHAGRIVIFDIGGVILNLHSSQPKRELLEDFLMDEEDFLNLTLNDFSSSNLSVTEQALTGQVSNEHYLKSFKDKCKKPVSIEQIERNRLGIMGEERPEMIELLIKIKHSFNIVAFSNTIDLHYRELWNLQRYKMMPIFEHIYPSHEIGAAKPSKHSFELILADLNCNPTNAIFIDDTAANVESASHLGINAILFRSYELLTQELGVLLTDF